MTRIKSVINQIKDFAKEDFPVRKVSHYLKNVKINQEELKKYIFYKKKRYTRNLIHREEDFELMIICWAPNISAPVHGHEGEKCWAKVLDGQLQICNYTQISENPLEIKLLKEIPCEPGYLDGPADIHSVENLSKNFAMSLHVYAKPYDACDIYNLEQQTVKRSRLGYYSINGIVC
ncbi:MAG: cysteine dioxygenase [Fidelibacterota bacterium]|jgi:cysteine dioxygenase|tara:strand:- start:3296 stop:3823 length:528 start_codon:yes stop_codon:yes gene_type:complete